MTRIVAAVLVGLLLGFGASVVASQVTRAEPIDLLIGLPDGKGGIETVGVARLSPGICLPR